MGLGQSLMFTLRGAFKGKLSILGEHISPPRVIERLRSDLYLVSYPKTGRTWLRMLMKTALHKHLGVPVKDPLEFHELTEKDERIPRISVVHDDEPHWKKTHELTSDKSKWYRNKKVILLIRDPRDTMVSLYIQMTKRWKVFTESEKTINEFIWQETGALKSMIEYYNIWAQNRDIPKDLLMIRYEDIHSQTLQKLRESIEFLGVNDTPNDTLNEAIEFNRLEKLKKREASGEFNTKRLKPGSKDDPESMKVRKGKVGGYQEYLSYDEACKIRDYTYEHLDPWYGYKALIENELKRENN